MQAISSLGLLLLVSWLVDTKQGTKQGEQSEATAPT